MATAYLVPAILRLQRSGQSESKTMTSSYATMYEDSDDNPWIFGGADIDLTNITASDAVTIRISVKNTSDGDYIVKDIKVFTGVQPDDAKQLRIGAFANTYGTKIEAYQNVGATYVELYMTFWLAKR